MRWPDVIRPKQNKWKLKVDLVKKNFPSPSPTAAKMDLSPNSSPSPDSSTTSLQAAMSAPGIYTLMDCKPMCKYMHRSVKPAETVESENRRLVRLYETCKAKSEKRYFPAFSPHYIPNSVPRYRCEVDTAVVAQKQESVDLNGRWEHQVHYY